MWFGAWFGLLLAPTACLCLSSGTCAHKLPLGPVPPGLQSLFRFRGSGTVFIIWKNSCALSAESPGKHQTSKWIFVWVHIDRFLGESEKSCRFLQVTDARRMEPCKELGPPAKNYVPTSVSMYCSGSAAKSLLNLLVLERF